MKKKILVVDDEESFTRLLKLNLEQTQKYVVRVENWADQALHAAHEFEPDIFILDVIMPRHIGSDIAAYLRADSRFRITPIIFLTAALPRPLVQEHKNVIAGFPVIAKPASVEEVIDTIEKYLPPARTKLQSNKSSRGTSLVSLGLTAAPKDFFARQ
jgi:DNA-binding response OmpR family regulator